MITFKELSRPLRLVIAAGALCAAMASIGVTAVWALDTRYVTIASVEQAFIKRDIRDLKRDIRKLEFLEKKGTISELEQFELDGLRQELEEIEGEATK